MLIVSDGDLGRFLYGATVHTLAAIESRLATTVAYATNRKDFNLGSIHIQHLPFCNIHFHYKRNQAWVHKFANPMSHQLQQLQVY